MTSIPASPAQGAEALRRRRRGGLGSTIFAGLSVGSGTLILVILAAVAVFLLIQAWPAISAAPEELNATVAWFPDGTTLVEFVGPLVFGTLLAAVLALTFATPVAIGVALFISHIAPRRLAAALGYVIDLLAAVPSVVYGLWGVQVLVNQLGYPVEQFLNDAFGFVPVFAGEPARPARSLLVASIVLAVMILPIITAVSREVFLQTPRLHEEASLALGATRWEMIQMAVFPFGRSGVVSAAMLGLGRALGETMAVLMILSPGLTYSWRVLEAGSQQTIAANIAAQFPEASSLGVNTLIATGLALFVITMAVNMLARWIVSRRAEFSGAN